MNEGEVVSSELVVAGCHTTALLDLIEKPFDQVASAVRREPTVEESSAMLQIEPYGTADLPVIEAFIEALHDAERELMPMLSPGAELAAAGLRQMLQDISGDKGMALLAKNQGRPIGFGCVLFDDYRDPAFCDAQRRRAYLSYLYVAAEWRRRGVGQALLAFMEAEARRRGCSRFVTRFKAANNAAMRCYEAAGFQPFESIVSKPIGGDA